MDGLEEIKKIIKNFVLESKETKKQITEIENNRAALALKRNEDVILAQNIKEVDRNFSEYLRKEIVDEIYPVLPNIADVFAIFSQIRKQTFNPKDFISAYTSSYGKTEDEARDILLKLFDHGIIGNQPSMKGQQIFKYQHLEALFNFNENIIIHRGLYKALQIFWYTIISL